MTAYIIKLVLCSGILLLAYMLLLGKEKMHRFNRFYLLLSLAFPLLVPFVGMEGQKELVPFSEPIVYMTASGEESSPLTVGLPAFSELRNAGMALDPIVLIYFAITTFLLFRFTKNLVALFKKIRAGEKLPYKDVTLVLCDHQAVPYSFFNYIFVNSEAYKKGIIEKEILQHELTHARQKHSLDILFTELLLCFTWFNPFVWVCKRTIQLNHEFLADHAVVKTFHDTASYQYLLLDTISRSSQSRLTSSFNYLITKKRLIMMTKISSPVTVALKQTVVLPLAALMVFLFSTKLVAQVVPKVVATVPAQQRAQQNDITKDTTRPGTWVQMTIGYTAEGASAQLMKEYQDIVNKYRSPDGLNWKDFKNISAEDRARLETIFKQMSIEQQSKQAITFVKSGKPLPKVVPTAQQFAEYKNPAVYGIWIDGKRVANEALDQYSNTDFSQVFVSKLYGGAKKGRSYSYQVDMMTNAYYTDYRNKSLAQSGKTAMMFTWTTGKGTGMMRVN